MGKRRDAKVAAAVTGALEKAGLVGSPMQSSGAQATPGTSIAVPSGKMPALAQSLARSPDTFGAQMGPNFPLQMWPLDRLGPNGRPDPRKYQYDISENLNISKRLATWSVLRAAAEQCDIVARMVTIRAAEVGKMDKSWIVSDEAVAAIRDRDGVGTAEASSTAREENKELIASLNEFWENPYPQSDRGWREWITEAIWQVMVYDGLAIHPQMNLGRDCIGLNIIDAPTIKCLLNNYGDTPRPPDPAFQQILWGYVRGEFTASPDSSAKGFVDGSYKTTMRDQLSYFVMNRRTWTPYGFSPVEQAIPLINLYLEYQKMMIFEFKHGTSSDVYMKTTGQEITLSTIANWERIYNDYTEGDTANRKKTRLLPEGFDPIFGKTVDEAFKPDYVESILKRLAGMFGVSSQQLGVIPHAGMGGGKGAQEGDQDNAETVSSKPLMNFIEEFVNSLSRRHLGANKNVTFILTDDKGGKDDVSIATAAKINTSSGVMVLNEQRRELGLDDYDFDGADEPFIVAGNTVVYLRGEFANQQLAGGTNGQEGAPPQASQVSEEGPQGQKPQVLVSAGGGEAPQADLKADEVKAFRKFSEKPRSREFVFKHHTIEESDLLKAGLAPRPKSSLTTKSAEDLPQHGKLSRLAKKHAGELALALSAGFGGIRNAVAHALNTSSGLADANYSLIARDAVSQSVTFNPEGASAVLGDLYQGASEIGAKAASDALGSNVAPINELLAKRGITLKGISDSSLKRISDTIAQGLQNGDGHRVIADAVNQIIADPKRADVISITESNRSYNAEFIGQLQAAGETQFDWVNDADPCPECEAELGLHDINDSGPPLHPSCRCVAVMANGDTAS